VNALTIVIREAELTDADKIVQHCKIVFEESEFLLTSPEEFALTVEEEQEWLAEQKIKRNLVLDAETEGQIIGMLNFNRMARKKVSHVGYFGISVQEKYCNQGIGRQLIERMIDWAKNDAEIEKVCLQVFAHNHRAIHLYKKLGFQVEGKKRNHVKINGKYVHELDMAMFVKDDTILKPNFCN
jgi:RimJ/RimL family protein N-acetyltransferase